MATQAASTPSIAPHERDVTHTVPEVVPRHPVRGKWDDSTYQDYRDKVLNRADGCWICGITQDGLKDADGMGQYLETHHYDLEWSLWHIADTDALQAYYDSGTAFDPYGFCADWKGKAVKHPGDPRNLLVLCPRHHRYAPDPVLGFGIHNGPSPLWRAQKFKIPDYQLVAHAPSS